MAKQRFHVLDGMRGIAAIIVMLYHFYIHAGSNFFINPFIAVDFFFILSGFVIMHSYGERISNGMRIADYISRRVIRLYPLFFIGIIIGLPALWFTSELGHAEFTHRDIIGSTISNLFFIPFLSDRKNMFDGGTAAGELFPTNGPLWSIFFEMFASLAFIYMAKLPKVALVKFSTACFVGVLIASTFNTFLDNDGGTTLAVGAGWDSLHFLSGFPRVLYGFSCGVALYKMRVERKGQKTILASPPPDFLALLVYVVLAGCLLFPHRVHGLYYFLSIAFIAPSLVWVGSQIETTSLLVTKLSEFFGWLSFPLYCVHRPILIGAYVLEEKYNLVERTGISIEVQAIVASLAFAIIITKIFDEPVRNWLAKRLKNKFGSSKPQNAHTLH